MTNMLRMLFLVGLGSLIGGISRYLATRYIQHYVASAFPFATFSINISGCFLIGLFYGISQHSNSFSTGLRLFLTVGFCGGFTTFSSFTNENMLLLQQGDFFHFALYTGLSVFLGLLATFFGHWLAMLL